MAGPKPHPTKRKPVQQPNVPDVSPSLRQARRAAEASARQPRASKTDSGGDFFLESHVVSLYFGTKPVKEGRPAMAKVKLCMLLDWPPLPGGAYSSYTKFPNAGEAVITELYPLLEKIVSFSGEFEGESHSYHYFAENEQLAKRVQELVAANLGKRLSELADLEVEK